MQLGIAWIQIVTKMLGEFFHEWENSSPPDFVYLKVV